jgi:hypothetical protein
LTKFDASTQFMRRAIVMVLLLFLPAANAYVAPDILPEETPMEFAGEVLLTLDRGVWTYEAWSSLHENGILPLRVVSPTELIGWQEGWIKSPSYTVSPSPEAVWKPGLDGRGPEIGDPFDYCLSRDFPAKLTTVCGRS